jgi:hypothetical protein
MRREARWASAVVSLTDCCHGGTFVYVRFLPRAGFLLILVHSGISAGTFSFAGTFNNDTDLQYFTFTLLQPTAGVALRTWSYAGGTNAAGQSIASGGFEPAISIFQSDGTLMNPGISGPCSNTGTPISTLLPDPVTGACADVYYPATYPFPGGQWAPGTYTVVLSIFANAAIGPTLADGFFAPQVLQLSVPSNFTCQVGSPGYQGNPPSVAVDQPFCDEWVAGVQRTGNWALDIVNVDSASQVGAVPEPASLGLVALGVLVAAGARRRGHSR